MKIHLVRHFPANKTASAEAEEKFGATKGGLLRPLDVEKATKLAPVFREKLFAENPYIRLRGHSPAVRAGETMLITTVGIADDAPVALIPELYWNEETIAGIMSDFNSHGANISKWSAVGLAALDNLGKIGAAGIRRVFSERNIRRILSGEEFFFVGHGPLVNATAYHLAEGNKEAKNFCLDTLCMEGDRFVLEYLAVGWKVRFVPLER